MKRSTLFGLFGLTAVVIVTLLLIDGRDTGNATDASDVALVRGLSVVVNDIDAIDIVAPGGAVSASLRRDEAHWRVAQKDGYRADFDKVATMLRDLSVASTIAPKTARAEWYARLGVSAMNDPDATGRRLDFPGSELPSVIIGQTDPTDTGSYARRVDEAGSWLLDQVIEAPVDPVSWLERPIMDIPASEIKEVLVRTADGETVRIQATDGDASPEFVLRDVPDGREAGAAWRRSTLANGLAALSLDDVRRFDDERPDQTARVLFVTIDGLNFILELFERDERHWAHITVSAETAAVDEQEELPADATADEATADSEASVENKASDPAAERIASAVAADARLSPWLFAISKRRFDDLTRGLEEYLEPLPEEPDEQTNQEG